MRGKASKGCEKEEESNKDSSEIQRLASLFLFHLSIIKGTKVDFLLLFLRQLPYLSGIEQFYIDINPCNSMWKLDGHIMWTLELVKHLKASENNIAWDFNHWIDRILGGFITDFMINSSANYS